MSGRCLIHRFELVLLSLMLLAGPMAGADEYAERRKLIRSRDATKRLVPEIPQKGERIRVVIDTDTRNEIDDVWALALAVLAPERFRIEGIVAANYDNDSPDAGPGSIEGSVTLAEAVLEKAGLKGKVPVKRGSAPMRYQFEPSESEGVDFIIERAMASTPEDRLWVVGLGASTNIASAYLKEPRIAERVIVFWHFRTQWPTRCWNFNVIGDVRAARTVFHSDLPFVLFDTGTHLYCPMEQSARWVEWGELPKFLHAFRSQSQWYQSPKKGFYDLGDVAALIDPDVATWEVVDCPEVDWDLAYKFRKTKGKILRCAAIDRDKTFALFEEKLRNGGARR
jgi:inosine-uridine nucleoside N-ribohydrolase